MLSRVIMPLIFGLAGTAILVSLGVWQMQRLEWKQDILAEIEAKIAADPVGVPQGASPADHLYLPVQTEGVIAAGELHVLVSQKRVGAGYRIIAPLELPDGRRILVDRGFTKTEFKTESRPLGAANISGNLHWPQETGSSIPEPDLGANIWFARDVRCNLVLARGHLGGDDTLFSVARPPTRCRPTRTKLMKYVSTRGAAPELTFEEAMLTGLARDGGLYVPASIPQLSKDDIRAMRGLSYEEVAFRVMRPFIGETFTDAEACLQRFCDAAHRPDVPDSAQPLGPPRDHRWGHIRRHRLCCDRGVQGAGRG